jgi:hypothetical protein
LWEAGVGVFEVAGLPVLAEDPPVLRRAMVVSQGCDLLKLNFPWVTVVPVWDATDILGSQQQASVRAGMIWHLVHLTAPWATTDRLWVADLRLEMPLDKTLLAAQAPTEAFADETGYARLAERLAAVRQRPAVPQPCIDHVVKPLRESLAARRNEGVNPLAGVGEIRVQSNDPVAPTAVTLFVVAQGDQQPDFNEWARLVESLYEQAAANGIVLTGPELGSLWDMTAADYLTSQTVDAADSS